jgi:ATP-dependent protease HslVU (ClpYQ) peptidase subunit
MTAIAGLVHDGRVYIGGDSAGVGGYMLTVRADTKVFRNGPYVMGFAGSFRMGQLLHWSLKPPVPEGKLERFMATKFVDAVRECLKTGGWLVTNSGRDEGGLFLVGVAGRLFRVDCDFQVGEAVDGWFAIGSGEEPALGALHATANLDLPPKKRLRLALTAADRYNTAVTAPFVICST